MNENRMSQLESSRGGHSAVPLGAVGAWRASEPGISLVLQATLGPHQSRVKEKKVWLVLSKALSQPLEFTGPRLPYCPFLTLFDEDTRQSTPPSLFFFPLHLAIVLLHRTTTKIPPCVLSQYLHFALPAPRIAIAFAHCAI